MEIIRQSKNNITGAKLLCYVYIMNELKKTLDKFYKDFNFRERVKHDPIEIPRRYSDPEDIEVAAFISSCFAYGKVDLFKPVIEHILKPGAKHPAEFIANFSLKKDAKYLKGVSYRFNREKDILCFLHIVSKALRKYRTLKDLFYSHFIRWIVRKKDIDLGIWELIPPSKLIIPLDTHIARISRCLGLTDRKSPDWKMAADITESLKKLDPGDPLKYDFALCHQGISGLCKGIKSSHTCTDCDLLPDKT